MGKKDKARVRRIVRDKYWFVKKFEESLLFGHLLIIGTVLFQIIIWNFDIILFLKMLIYVSMCVLSVMIVLLAIWLFIYTIVLMVCLYEITKHLLKTIYKFIIKVNNKKKNDKKL